MLKNNFTKKQKVFVGMSGGVDSSVSALLLKEAGYEVTGVFIKVWQPDFVECTWKEDRQDAMRVASELGIPFITLDLEQEYKERVIDYMIREYKEGRTPNPDVFCNKEVKFGAFLTWALANGADYVATGHYARKENGSLARGLDKSKDQSYFLWTLTKEQLSHILFPVGSMSKTEIRKIAEKNKLYTAQKKDSQGLCFIGKIEVKDFLEEFIKSEPGEIVDQETGQVIGKHKGIYFYTLGEKINGKYVVSKDLAKNILYVSENLVLAHEAGKIILEEINFTQDLKVGETYLVEERYHASGTKIKILSLQINPEKKQLTLEYELNLQEKDFLYIAGQSLVFYQGEILVGGGIMK